ncbi:lipopolysaccharide assembly protein [Lutibacter oceani]|uniref:Lipopolysaccharide assembly protein n=1 Tax=Lutibacter oceani TaxID=1853311 RepID=A0A3D9RSW3_9FLAO|nr:LptE family protein [Lutibacter oceani]REE82947.1 lipopolysaccharide assembly protein [Lutibacter oceani]
MKKIGFLLIFVSLFTFQSCGIYSFTGTNISPDVKTIQIDYFPNEAILVEPSLSQTFTTQFQDLFLTQTNLSLVKSGGDLQFEGEITGYKINPMTATAQQTAAQNRLTITINVRFFNNKNEEDNFEKSFSHYYDYDANAQLIGGALDDAFDEIIERISQDIFNASVAKW